MPRATAVSSTNCVLARLSWAILFVLPGSSALAQCDPSLIAEVFASDGVAGDGYGSSVAIDGERMIVGAQGASFYPPNAGAAYVLERSGGVWTETAKLTASDASAGDGFGITVALRGDLALVGAWKEEDGAEFDRGAVYVFENSGGSWTEVAKLVPSDGNSEAFFGYWISLDASGARAIVGAPGMNVSITYRTGAAYVFDRVGGVWSETAKLTASDESAFTFFGATVAIDGDRAAVGTSEAVTGAGATGAVYVFDFAGGSWSQTAKLVGADSLPGDAFGYAVSLEGDRLVATAPNRGSRAGAAYVFEQAGGSWSETALLVAADAAPVDFFGSIAVLSGDRLLITAQADDAPATDSGSAYLFDIVGGTWAQTSKIVPADLTTSEAFGFWADIDGDTIVVTGNFDDDVAADAGSAYVYSIVAPELCCRRGNVNAGAGPIVDVLFVNGSVGDPVERKIVMSENDPFSMAMFRPPSKPSGTSRYALYAWLGFPTAATTRILPFALGSSCMPMPITSDGPPNPKQIWNNAGHNALLGAPTLPSAPAPTVILSKPGGIGKTVTFFLQGIILDSAAPNGQAAVTNGIVVELQ